MLLPPPHAPTLQFFFCSLVFWKTVSAVLILKLPKVSLGVSSYPTLESIDTRPFAWVTSVAEKAQF